MEKIKKPKRTPASRLFGVRLDAFDVDRLDKLVLQMSAEGVFTTRNRLICEAVKDLLLSQGL